MENKDLYDESNEPNLLPSDSNDAPSPQAQHTEHIADMYKDYFLDYASYVILERAIPAIEDGLKPVQRRILHSMNVIDDGRFNKVANVIGQTMQYHPHGDAAIGEALVNLGQKNLLIDCQGNWGDVRTGDSAAAPRYIEARLSKFAQEVAFNHKTTQFQLSYDGRKKEPIALPMKFPLLLAQGVEGIAVGLSTKILPHNFVELVQGSIAILRGEKTQILPDFPTGGMMDASQYHSAKRGSKVRVRAKIEIQDKKNLVIREIPFGTTTSSIIDSILKAAAKNKIKVKKVTDNTAQHVEVLVELPAGVSPEQTMDALYAFSDCEVSISPMTCVIKGEKPIFTTVDELLEYSTHHTKDVLKKELEIEKHELEEKWHFASLEKIFIEKKIYAKIENCETWEAVLETIAHALKPHTKTFKRAITQDDIIKLTEIKVKRISKFNKFQADDYLQKLEEQIQQTQHHLDNLVAYAVAYFENLLKKYGAAHQRKTIITNFDTIEAATVALNNEKLYINREEGFIGYGLKKDEFIEECSDLDDVIIFHNDGSFSVVKIAEKVFVGKNPLYVAVWRKNDQRKVYNMVYTDLDKGGNYVKRFAVLGITRDKKYPVADGIDKSKVLYFSANANGEAETISIQLTQSCSAKKKDLEYNFADLEIKGRGARGNVLTKYPIRKVKLKTAGVSTLGALQIWLDDTSGKLNTTEYGRFVGAFGENDRIIAFYKNASYEMTNFDLVTNRFEIKDLLHIGKFNPQQVVSVIYYDGERRATYAKRFVVETTSLNQRFEFLPNASSELLFLSVQPTPRVSYQLKGAGGKSLSGELDLGTFVEVMGWKALGAKISDMKLAKVTEILQEQEAIISEDISTDNQPSIFG